MEPVMHVPSFLALAFFRRRVPLGVSDRGRRVHRSGDGVHSRSADRRRGRGLAQFESLEARLALAVNVTTLADTGDNSLRWAIDKVNTAGVADTISFNGLGAGTIALKTALPTLTNPGTTFSFGSGTTAITLDGAAAGLADGLTIAANVNSVILNVPGLTLRNFNNGLKFLGASTGSSVSGLTISNNLNGIALEGGTFTGTKIANNTISLNSQNGILATSGVTGLTIGGTTAGDANTISLNGNGLFFQPGTYTNTVVAGNTITNNNTSGVRVSQGSYSGTVLQGNTIASNGGYGVQLAPAGQSITGLTIGGTTAGQGNTIASNAADGIGVFGGTYTSTAVQGNTIQYNQNSGVNINPLAGGGAFSGLTLGGPASAGGNTIDANGLDGVLVNGGTYTGTAVQGNTITGNGRNGVNFSAPFGGKLTGFTVGGTSSKLGNTITGNTVSGLAASKGDYSRTRVLGNTISSNANGISLIDVQNLTIGAPTDGFVGVPITDFKNTINSNTATGLLATGLLTGTTFRANSLTGNVIGVSLRDAQGLAVGGTDTGGGNTIAGGTSGIRAVGNLSNSHINGNVITGQPTGIILVNAAGTAAQPFFVGGATSAVGTGAGNYVQSTVCGIYAGGTLTSTTVAGNTFVAGGSGNGMVLDNATGLTVGGTTASLGNLLTAPKGNGLWATGNLSGSGVYRNNIQSSQYGIALVNARALLVGATTNAALGNLIQYNTIGLFAAGNCTGSSVCYTIWYGNVRKVANSAIGLLVFPKP
jgi:Periplasmic copper-binding protein (NosD)